jgi:hypothetical protein
MDNDYGDYVDPLNMTNEDIVDNLDITFKSHYDLIMGDPELKKIYERKKKEQENYVNNLTKTTIGSIIYYSLCFIKYFLLGD